MWHLRVLKLDASGFIVHFHKEAPNSTQKSFLSLCHDSHLYILLQRTQLCLVSSFYEPQYTEYALEDALDDL